MNTSYASNSANPVSLALAYYRRGSQGLDRDRDDDIYDRYNSPPLHSNSSYSRKPRKSSQRAQGGSVLKKMMLALLLVLVIGGGGGVFWIQGIMQDYVPISSNKQIAHAHLAQSGGFISVELVFFDNQGHNHHQVYTREGDEIVLTGDTITFSKALSFLPAGFKLTHLESRYREPDIARTHTPESVTLNNGDDSPLQGSVWNFVGATTTVSDPLILTANHDYSIFVSPKGPYVKLVS